MMKKKLLTILTTGIMALSSAVAMTSCDGSSDNGGTGGGSTGKSGGKNDYGGYSKEYWDAAKGAWDANT